MTINFIGAFFLIAQPALASTINTDTLTVSSVAARQPASGIYLSSHANLSANSSITLRDAGQLTSASSITASAFFGDGTNLSGLTLLTGTNTFSGENKFTSSISAQSGGLRITISTGSTTANIDISTYGVTSFYPQLHTSTRGSIAEFSTTATSLGPCVTGSTLSLTTSGGRVEVAFTGTLKNSAVGLQVSFLQDGQFVRDLSSTASPGYFRPDNGSNTEMTISFAYLLDAPSAGLHNYCLTICASRFFGGTATLLNNSTVGNLFYLVEIK